MATFGPETPEFTLLTIAPFAAIRQKSAYHVKYLRISWIYLYLLNRFGRRIGGDDYPNVCLAVTQGTLLYDNQLNLEDGHRHRQQRPLLHTSAFDNGSADRKSAFKRLNEGSSRGMLATARPCCCISDPCAQHRPRNVQSVSCVSALHAGDTAIDYYNAVGPLDASAEGMLLAA